MALSGGLITCKLEHSHKVLIVNSYATDLYLSWSIEFWERLKQVPFTDAGFLDVSSASFDKQLLIRARFKRLLTSARTIERVLARKYLPLKDHQIYASFWRIKFMQAKCALNLMKIFPHLLRAKHVNDFLNIPVVDFSALRSTHSTLAGKIGTVEYSPRRYCLRIFLYLISYLVVQTLVSRVIISHNYCQVTVGNGRLLNAASVLSGASNISTLVIERGAMPGMLDSYCVSAHSMSERRAHLNYAWESVDRDLAEKIAVSYLETRKNRDPISGVSWTSKQRSGVIPEIDAEKKVCVFYTTTELEFAVFFDSPTPGEFSTQNEALRALIESLDSHEWVIFVRRHPYSRMMLHDPEGRNWSEFKRFKHVKFISPDSNVDSYALGARADLVAHFNSSIGPELVFQGSCPVITLGDNSWELTDSKYLLRNQGDLREFLESQPGIRPRSDAFKWAYYSATFGEKFQLVEWRNFRGYIDGKHLLSRNTNFRLMGK
jgi:hypothetical protein